MGAWNKLKQALGAAATDPGRVDAALEAAVAGGVPVADLATLRRRSRA